MVTIFATILCFIGVIFACILFYFAANFRYYWLTFKFPRVHSFIPNFFVAALYYVTHYFDLYQVLQQMDSPCSGKIVSTWLPSFIAVVKKPEHLQTVFSNKALNDKSFHYAGVSQLLGSTGLVTAQGEMYKNSKKIFHQAFNGRSHDIIMKSLICGTNQLLDTLESKAGKDWFKMMPISKHTTTTIVLDNALDMRLPEDDPLYQTIEEDYEDHLMTALLGAVFDQIPLVSKFLSFKGKIKEVRSTVDKYLDIIYKEKQKKFSDLVGKNEEVPNQYIYNILRERDGAPINYVYDDMTTVVFAALDTTSITIASCIVLLGMHQDIQQEVFNEDQRIQKELAGRKMLQESDFQRYEFLQRVIKETLRLYPSVPIYARHVDEEVQLGEYTLPKGSTAAVFVPYVHRNPNLYPNPMRFDPDRFLPVNVEKRHKLSYLPFSYGTRQCPGMRYATQSAVYIISSMVRNFKIISKYKTIQEMDKNIRGFVTLSDVEGFPIRLEKRQS